MESVLKAAEPAKESAKRVIIQVPVTEDEKRELKKIAIDRDQSMGQMLREVLTQNLL